MSPRDDGGPAFPLPGGDWNPCDGMSLRDYGGMSLRDYFAAQALTGMFASGGHKDVAAAITEKQQQLEMSFTAAQISHETKRKIASLAYWFADAMLAERGRPAAPPEAE